MVGAMSSSRLLIRTVSSTNRALAQYSRSYFNSPRPIPKSLPQTPVVKVPKAPASTDAKPAKPGTANPDVVSPSPTTANEAIVEALPEVGVDGGSDKSVTDWSKSYFGLSSQAFSKDIADILLAPIDPSDVEMKPGLFVVLLHTSFTDLKMA